MAVAFIPMMPEIHELCSFSSTMDDVQITFMMTRPRESATGSGLLAPFDRTVWICILIALIVFGPSIYVLIHLRYVNLSFFAIFLYNLVFYLFIREFAFAFVYFRKICEAICHLHVFFNEKFINNFILDHRTIMSEKGHPEGYSLRTCIWFAYGALLKQGSTVTPVTGIVKFETFLRFTPSPDKNFKLNNFKLCTVDLSIRLANKFVRFLRV